MSDIRFNNWLHQSGTGGVYQTSAGNVGVGSTVPRTALDVAGIVTASSFSGVNITASGDSTFGGLVGIGTDNPTVRLDIVDSGSPNIALRGSSFPSIRYSGLDGTTDAEIYYGIGGNDLVLNNVNAGPTAFKTNNIERLRIKSDGNTGINQTNPNKAKLHVVSNGDNLEEIVAKFRNPYSSSGNSVAKIGFVAGYSDTANDNEGHAYIGAFREGNGNRTSLVFQTSTGSAVAEQFKISSNGHVTAPSQPAFYAYRAGVAGQVSAGDQIFDTTKTNRGGHYSTSNGRFTAPVGGAYFFSAALQLYGAPTTGHMMSFRINGTDFHGSQNSSNPVYDEPAGAHSMLYFSAVINLAANEYVTTWTNQTVRGMQSYFTGYLIG